MKKGKLKNKPSKLMSLKKKNALKVPVLKVAKTPIIKVKSLKL